MQSSFRSVQVDFDFIFHPTIQGTLLRLKWTVEPPQRNGRLPQYARYKLVDLQNKFDQLVKLGVFKRPKNINVTVEYLYPSFLATKSNGGYRLVTAFSDVRSYSKPQPLLTPDVDSTLRQSLSGDTLLLLIITTHECLLSNPSRTRVDEILRVANLFRGVQVYACSAMDMPGSETGTHVSCTWRPYSRRSCCQDRRRCILRSRLTIGVTTQSANEYSRPSLIATSSSPRPKLLSTWNGPWSWSGSGTLSPSRPPRIVLQP